VRLACQRAVDRARAGEGPTLVEAKTYRYYDHQGVKGLRRPYRTEEEVEAWKKRDAIELLEARAAADGVVEAAAFARVWEETRADAAEAIAFAQTSPEPDPSTLTRNVYTD
jgi:acetoin:2,6-dichlorophenolindophenol oxidoreductase subunit alpha